MYRLDIRNIDHVTEAFLKSEAKRLGRINKKKVGMVTVARQILADHALMAEIKKVEDKYQDFAEKVILLYKEQQQETNEIIERNNRLLSQMSENMLE